MMIANKRIIILLLFNNPPELHLFFLPKTKDPLLKDEPEVVRSRTGTCSIDHTKVGYLQL